MVIAAKKYSKIKILFDFFISANTFPDHWKIADVVPGFNYEDQNYKACYRPISHLSLISKIFETLLADSRFCKKDFITKNLCI